MLRSLMRPFMMGSCTTTTTTEATLLSISQALEDVLIEGVADADVAIGCQRLSHFYAQEQRYRMLAARCRKVWLCAVLDCPPPEDSDLNVVPLRAEWLMADERFLVVNAPGFAGALLATEAQPEHGGSRSFETLFTSEPRFVNALCRTLEIELGIPMTLPASRDAQAQQRHLKRFNQQMFLYQEQQEPPRTAARRADGAIWPTPLRARQVGDPLVP